VNETVLTWLGGGGFVIGMAQLVAGLYKDRKSRTAQKGQAEAAKATLDAAQAEAAMPHVQESLKLGNVSEAVAILNQVINGLREHAAWQDERLEEAHAEIRRRDEKIATLEERLNEADGLLAAARKIIDELRAPEQQADPSV